MNRNALYAWTLLCAAPCLSHAEVIVTHDFGIDTPNMLGFKTYTLTARSTDGNETIVGFDFSAGMIRSIGMNQINPNGLPTVYSDYNSIFSSIGADPRQDSQFLVRTSDIINLSASEGSGYLGAAFLSRGISDGPGFGTVFPFARIVAPLYEPVYWEGEVVARSLLSGQITDVPVFGAIFPNPPGIPPLALDVNLGDRPRGSIVDHMFETVIGDRPFLWSNLEMTGPGFPAIAPELSLDGRFIWNTTNSPLGSYTFDTTVSNQFGSDIANLTLNLVEDCNFAPGVCQSNPILPSSIEPGRFFFNGVSSGAWFDPPAVSSFEYTAEDGTLFSGVLDFPTGFSNPFTVSIAGSVLGHFGPGQSVDFVSLLGGGVAEFTVSGINPLVDAEDPQAFPLQIAFTTPMGSFSMRAVIPEPTSLVLLVGAIFGVWLQRGRTTNRERFGTRCC